MRKNTTARQIQETSVDNSNKTNTQVTEELAFFVTEPTGFQETHEKELRDIEVAMNSEKGLLLQGPKGVGKTLRVYEYAYRNKIPIVRHDCSEGTKDTHLKGYMTIHNGNSRHEPGVLPHGIETANKYGKAIILLDEINSLVPGIQKILNPLLDFQRSIVVEYEKKRYSLNKDSKLLICGTMNDVTYAGVNKINEDLQSRVLIRKVKYPDTKDEMNILKTDDIPKNIVNGMLEFANDTRKSHKQGDIEYAISPRDLDNFFEVYRRHSSESDIIDLTFDLVINSKYNTAEEKETVQNFRIKQFGRGASA